MRTLFKKIMLLFYYLKYRKDGVHLHWTSQIGRHSAFEGMNRIGARSIFRGSIGFASYIGSDCVIDGKIGRFCSIANHVQTVIGKHPTRQFVSTHPSFFSVKKQAGFTFATTQLFEESTFADSNCNQIVVGNDVWIGHGATIFSGVTIGDGAVIAAGSMVTTNVLPYTIVGGIPAKIIRERFSSDVVNMLLNIKWWNWDMDKLSKYSHKFTDIHEFIECCTGSCKVRGVE